MSDSILSSSTQGEERQQSVPAGEQPIDSQILSSTETQTQPYFKGACYCKAITFTITSLPIKSRLCHCIDCRQITGTSFAHNIVFPCSALTVSARAIGEPTDTSSLSSSPPADIGELLSIYGDIESGSIQFCKICGSRLFLFPPGGNVGKSENVVVTAGAIDGSHEDERLRPTDEGFCKRRESWMSDMKGTRTFQEW